MRFESDVLKKLPELYFEVIGQVVVLYYEK
jgi:hypothetical protein